MLFGYYSFLKECDIANEVVENELIRLNNGYIKFDKFKSDYNYQLVGLINKDRNIKIQNPIGNNFQSDFVSYDALIFYLSQKDYFFKITLILYDELFEEFHLFRDQFGVCPLYYIHILGKFVAFSSNLTSLLTTPSLSTYLQPNVQKISQYLTWLADGDLYSSATFFENFYNVLPGSKIVLGVSKKETDSYIQFDLKKWKGLTEPEEFGEAFRDLFKKSVNRGLEQAGTVGAQLSGGLDSSSICSTIRLLKPDLPIHTIYLNTKTSLTDEHSYALEVTKHIDSIHHVLEPDFKGYESANLHISLYGQPEYMLNSSGLNRTVMSNAISYGCSTLFIGDPGDAIVGYGREHIMKLFDDGQWDLLKEQISDPTLQMATLKAGTNNPAHKIIYSLLARKKGVYGFFKMAKLILKASKFFDIPFSYFYHNAKRKILDKFRIPGSILKPKYDNYSTSTAEMSAPAGIESSSANSSFYDVFTTQSILINEEFYILDQYYGVRHEFPFLDQSLFELCMSVPSKIKFDNGRQRGHLREAMKGILPEMIRNRTSKANFGIYGRKMIIELYNESLDVLSSESQVWEYVDKKQFLKSVKLLLSDSEQLHVYNRMIFFVSKTVYLAIWLDKLNKKSFQIIR